MVFASYPFVFGFLPIVLAGYWVLCRYAGRAAVMAWLVLVSLVFYGWWNPIYVPLIGVLLVINYFLGIAVAGSARFRGVICACGVALNLAVLAYFKYAGFLTTNINALGFDVVVPAIALPLAISFFTFQKIAFLVDVYKGRATPGSFLEFSLFVLFFPQLIAGPIVHFREIVPQFRSREFVADQLVKLAPGAMVFVIGLFKKVGFADQVSRYVGPTFDAADAGKVVTFSDAWGASLAYAMQIYFDFSGYTDMAIGLGMMFGVSLPLNFSSPYKATSLIDFWRRWHITLSRFLRDYLYVPLGGNRAGELRRYENLLIVMLLGGLWHGASWNFVVWGGLHGLGLAGNHLWRAVRQKSAPTWTGMVISWMATFSFVVFAWVFFRATTFAGALEMVRSMLGLNGFQLGGALFDQWGWLFIIGLLAVVLLTPNTQQIMGRSNSEFLIQVRWRPTAVWGVCAAAVFVASIYLIDRYSPFIYFNF